MRHIPHKAAIRDYLAGIQHVGDKSVVADLSLNENRLGSSKLAREAYAKAAAELWRYPDGSHAQLKSAIAKHFGIRREQVACGAGADELITLLTRIFVHAGNEVLFPEFSFIMFPLNALHVGATAVRSGTDDYYPSVNDLLSRITSRTRIIFLASPNNPTGAYLSRDDLEKLIHEIPAHIPFVLDAVYAEYMVDNPHYSDGFEFLSEAPNLIILRSFSKVFGLASLRIGWCFAAPEIIRQIDQIKGPYNVSGPALAAAVAALDDNEHVSMSRKHTNAWLNHIANCLNQLGIRSGPRAGNFILAEFESSSVADRAYSYLRECGVLTRRLIDYELPRCLRITIGNDVDNQLLLKSLNEFADFETRLPRSE
jgi:histidinol-phosphate aminotransferase